MTTVEFSRTLIGSDAEFFFKKDGEIIGSELVIPFEGLTTKAPTDTSPMFIVRDGVQAELHTIPRRCRAFAGNDMKALMLKLKEHLKKHPSVSACFDQVVEIKQYNLDILSEESKSFGCMPSYNIYATTPDKIIPITQNPQTYLFRAGGGHIHLGRPSTDDSYNKERYAVDNPELLVPLLDLIVGNTLVLIDRNPLIKERRKAYGRAGEYRTPKHGLEYRVPSNFWLRDYKLMSFVFGLCRYAISIVETDMRYSDMFRLKQTRSVWDNEKQTYVSEPHEETNFSKKILSLVPQEDIIKAINDNDFDLAKQNFDKIKDYLTKITRDYADYPLGHLKTELFEFFVDKGLDYWFGTDVLNNWENTKEGHGEGWENFLIRKVLPEYEEYKRKNNI